MRYLRGFRLFSIAAKHLNSIPPIPVVLFATSGMDKPKRRAVGFLLMRFPVPSLPYRLIPWLIVATAGTLMILGIASIARVAELTDGPERLWKQQTAYAVLGMIAMSTAAWPSYRRLARASYALLFLTLVLLVVVYFFPPVNAARRWIRLGPLSLQPSEFAKVAFILALAEYLKYRENFRRLRGLVVPLAMALAPVLLILPEPDLGRVRLGARARITSDSYGDRAFDGWVGFVSPVAEFTPKTVETTDLRTDLVYRLRRLLGEATPLNRPSLRSS